MCPGPWGPPSRSAGVSGCNHRRCTSRRTWYIPSLRFRCVLSALAFRAIPGSGSFDWFRAALAALGAAVALALHGGFRADFLSRLVNDPAHRNLLRRELAKRRKAHPREGWVGFFGHSLKVVMAIHAVKSSRCCG